MMNALRALGAWAALAVLGISLLAQRAEAQGSDALVTAPLPPATGRPAVLKPGIRAGEIRIDGRIEESTWEAAPAGAGFVQSEPLEGERASRDTHVKVLLDEDAMYVSARLLDHPDSMRLQLVRRDEEGSAMDWFGVSVDPNHDRRTGYSFQVSSSNVQRDVYIYDDATEDLAWNAVWESAVANDSLGWSVAMRIPLSQIRYDSGDALQTWGINFHRRLVASAELSHFALQSRRIKGISSQYGTLEDVEVPPGVRRIEARPYVLSTLHRAPQPGGEPVLRRQRLGGALRG